MRRNRGRWVGCLGLVLALATGGGCSTPFFHVPPDSQLPRELSKVSMPAYVIEPPDVLVIDALRIVPKPPYKIEPLDTLLIRVTGTDPQYPIEGVFQVEPEGNVNFGAYYGTIRVVGLTPAEARAEIESVLKKSAGLKDPKANVSLAQSRAQQQIRGEHLVRPDGTVGLGLYGSVYVAGMTLQEAKSAIEAHLSATLLRPEISIDVLSYNSKVYYVITDGAGFGMQVYRLPITGNETVLDAISQVNGLPPVASMRHIWVARPTPDGKCGEQLLPVDWCAITAGGSSQTNYQILPGDRIYVRADALITIDNAIAKIVTPVERIFGVTLLGNQTVRSFGSQTNATSGVGGF